MAGHSKWANIRFRKAAQDSKRGKIFTKLIRAITVAARQGGEDLLSNPRLRDAIDKALKANMKRDTINNAIKRGVGDKNSQQFEELTYEGYGPGGVAILVACLTDNRNRTVAEVRHAFSKAGGSLGIENSVAYLFTKYGQLIFAPDTVDEERLFDVALEAGAEDISTQADGSIEIVTDPANLAHLKQQLCEQNIDPVDTDVVMVPANTIILEGEQAQKLLDLVDVLEELDDVQNIYSNADIPADVMESMG
jgi:YebC/PmpR family DNA-binding regulatory protein